MKIEIECEIPAGYEATGEYRAVTDCTEPHLSASGCLCFSKSQHPRIILRKKAPAMRPMTHDEILYIITSPHCVIKFDGPGRIWVESGRMMPGPNTKVGSVEYGFIREDGTVDGPYKFEKEV